ncbi:serpin family protein [Kitasatospora cinereorecta]|uniref:Serpin family protein n=1 Tax=Kitasatospora cinereorecta TaxID=285560 RepID=A0ABW0VEM0_9ACTN
MAAAATVRAVKGLAARWAGLTGDAGTVSMPAGLWPLLAFLAAGAHGPAVAELEDALGMRTADALPLAHDLLAELAARPGHSAALGLWTSEAFRPAPSWLADLPAGAHGTLAGDEATDRARLDAWASRSTDGQIDRMPLEIDGTTRLVLASALAVRTSWLQPFVSSFHRPEAGPWAARELCWIGRSSAVLDRASVAETPIGPVTELRVLGEHSIDVHLLLGEAGAAPGDVLAAGLGMLDGTHRRVTADRLPTGTPGPGLTIGYQPRYRPQPRLHVVLPEFSLRSEHDLLEHPARFGLAAASDAEAADGHFRGITTEEPLYVQSARQHATATFGPLGFRAAAVTAFGLAAGSAPGRYVPPPYRVLEVEADFDRPFGFLAVHRGSRLVLASGWVTDPVEHRWEDDESEDDDPEFDVL